MCYYQLRPLQMPSEESKVKDSAYKGALHMHCSYDCRETLPVQGLEC